MHANYGRRPAMLQLPPHSSLYIRAREENISGTGARPMPTTLYIYARARKTRKTSCIPKKRHRNGRGIKNGQNSTIFS